jgi:hypothetical protein
MCYTHCFPQTSAPLHLHYMSANTCPLTRTLEFSSKIKKKAFAITLTRKNNAQVIIKTLKKMITVLSWNMTSHKAKNDLWGYQHRFHI